MPTLIIQFKNDFEGTLILTDDEINSRRTGKFEVSFRTTSSYHIKVLFDDDIYKLNEWYPIEMPNPNSRRKDIERYLEGRFGVITAFDKIEKNN